ncbi:hypothetical protein Tco_1380217, partial [Tanacetum coccineum]
YVLIYYIFIRVDLERIKKKQEPTYTIKLTDKAALEEFDLKSALFKSMHKNISANRNPANYRLYHALLEALIEDKNAIDKEVADTGKSSKKRRTRESDSAKKPSTTKESSKGKDPKVGSKIGKSAPAKDLVEEPTDKVIVDEQSTEDILISDEGHVLDLEDIDNAHMPKIPDKTTWFRPITEEERPASPEPEWVIPPIDLPKADNNWIGKEELSKADLKGPAFMMVKGDKERNRALSIFKLKAALYLEFGLEELVLSLWIESEREYDISAAYGITHWWFRRKQFYINKHSEPSDRDAVRSHMRILSVISIKTYERYGYNYLREIVLRRADYNEYKISEKDFKSLHTKAGHCSFVQRGQFIDQKHYQKETDDNRKMMRINEVHKFSDGTLTRIKEKLDFMVKDFKLLKFNKGMENRKWSEDDKRRSEDFIETILRVLHIILMILPEHLSEMKVFLNEDGNPARANIKQALGR